MRLGDLEYFFRLNYLLHLVLETHDHDVEEDLHGSWLQHVTRTMRHIAEDLLHAL